jgi:hypothetical protein
MEPCHMAGRLCLRSGQRSGILQEQPDMPPLQVSTDAQAACASWPQHGKTADSQPHPLHHVHGRHRMAEWRRMGGKVPDVKGQGRSAAASPSWHMGTALNHEVPCTGPRMACAGSMIAAKKQQTCPENMSRSACRSFASELLLKGSGSMISCQKSSLAESW